VCKDYLVSKLIVETKTVILIDEDYIITPHYNISAKTSLIYTQTIICTYAIKLFQFLIYVCAYTTNIKPIIK
jgi:hypothetical protein